MENLIGLLIFAGIAAVSMIAKFAEKRKAELEQQARQAQRHTRREDLPEATRRVLFGEGTGPRTATPRSGEPKMAQPRTGEAPTARPVPVPPSRRESRPAAAVPNVRRPREQRMAETSQRRHGGMTEQPRALVQPSPRPTVEPRVDTARSPREAYRQTHPRGEEQRPAPPGQPVRRRHRRPRPSAEQHAARQRNAPMGQKHPAHRKCASDLAWLFSSPKTVRHGIVMMEILGRPKGLEDS